MASANPPTPKRWILPAAAILMASAALAGLGLYLAFQQTRAAVQLQQDSLRAEARRLAGTIQSDLRREMSAILVALATSYPKQPSSQPGLPTTWPAWCSAWFVLDRGEVHMYPPAPPASDPELDIKTAPIWFLEAEQVELREKRLDAAITMYRRCIGPATPPPWQHKATLAIARCQRNLNQPEVALTTYKQLLDDLPRTGDRLGIRLAIIDTLIQMNSPKARQEMETLLDEIWTGKTLLLDRADAEMVIRRMNQTHPSLPPQKPELRQKLMDLAMRREKATRLRARIETLTINGSLNDSYTGSSNEPAFIQGGPQQETDLIACQAFPSPAGSNLLIGVSIDTEQLAAGFLAATLSREAPGRIVLMRRPDSPSPHAQWAESLAPLLPVFSLTPAQSVLDEIQKRAHTQRAVFLTMALLFTGTLTTAIVLGLRAVRRELETARLRNEFVANVSHELKTPLALIRLFAETLLYNRVNDPSKIQNYYEIITRESERLTHLIDNILDFSRIQTGRKSYTPAIHNIGEIVQATVNAYAFQLDHAQITHDLNIDPDLPLVNVDSDAISQAILNLINNSVKYSREEKYVSIHVSALPEREGVAIEVRDRGIGITQAEQEKIFDPFYRGCDDRVRKIRGSGLGLALVRHIVEAHGGTVSVRSKPGEGSTFRIELPSANTPAEPHHTDGTSQFPTLS